MNIFIDSNILFQDYFFENKSNKNLLQYCKEGLLKIHMSEIVRLELRRQFEKEIKATNKELEKIQKNIARLKLEEDVKIISIENQLKKFDDFYNRLTNIDDFKILNYSNEFLPDIVNRAVNRIKPFTEEKSELKDAIIWKTYSFYVEQGKLDNCIFLTNNTSDFCTKKDKSNIHPELLVDTRRFKVVNSSFDFIKEYGPEIESPENKFQAYFKQVEINETFVLEVINDNFRKEIYNHVHARIDFLHPSDILDIDYIIDGQLIPYDIEIFDCAEIESEVLSDKALISGTVYVSCETEVLRYNPVRDPGEDQHTSVAEVAITYKIHFNFDLRQDEDYSEFEITDMEISSID